MVSATHHGTLPNEASSKNEAECSIETCDIFDFMAEHVGLTVLHPGGFEATQELANACHIGAQIRVLDNACGKGTSAVYLAQKYGCQVVGIDIADHLIAQAKDLAKRKGMERLVSFRVADALDLPFSDGEFDVAVSQAMLVLVSDKKKAIQESLRVVKAGGRIGSVELSWKQPPTPEFLKAVSDVICAKCMLNVQIFEEWEKLFSEAGASQLETIKHSMKFDGMTGMTANEGLANTIRVMLRYLTNSRIRKRMDTMDRFFKAHTQYFGYGIYVGTK